MNYRMLFLKDLGKRGKRRRFRRVNGVRDDFLMRTGHSPLACIWQVGKEPK